MTKNINTSKDDGHDDECQEEKKDRLITLLFKELAIEDSGGFAEYMRMSHHKSKQPLKIRIGPSVQKKDTPMRNLIPPGERFPLGI